MTFCISLDIRPRLDRTERQALDHARGFVRDNQIGAIAVVVTLGNFNHSGIMRFAGSPEVTGEADVERSFSVPFQTVFSILFSDRRQMEILALRHQIGATALREEGPKLTMMDRVFWAWLSEVWADRRSALVIVKRKTVIAWEQGLPLVLDLEGSARMNRKLHGPAESPPAYEEGLVSTETNNFRTMPNGEVVGNHVSWGADRIFG
jgi:hypothetical protein